MRRVICIALLAILAFPAGVLQAQPVTAIGLVTDVEGLPLADAVVEVYRDKSFISVTKTLQNGYFSLTLPGIGTYEIVVYKWGYERRTVKLDLLSAGTTNLGRIALGYALVVGLGTTHIVADQGSTVELPLSVANLGAFTVLVNVTIDAPLDWDASLLSEQNIVIKNLMLGPSESRALKVRVHVPTRAKGSNMLVLRFSYANVTQNVPLTIEARPRDWELVSPFYNEITSFSGIKFSVPLRVRNTLEQSCVMNITVIPPRGWLAAIAVNGTRVTSLRLSPGESVVAQLTITLPENAEPGSYVVVLQARALDVISRSTLIIHVEPKYDRLMIDAQSQFIAAKPGDKVTVPLRITNDGTRAALVNFAVDGLPAGYHWVVKDEYENVLTAITIPPKESRDILLTIDVPQTAFPTAIAFTFRAIGANSSSEAKLFINIIGKQSFSIVNQNWEIELSSGSSAMFRLLLENNGQIPLREVSISLGDVPSGDIRVVIEPTRVLGLQPGGKVEFTLTVIAGENLEAGRYLIPVVISGDGIRAERVLAVNVRAGGGFFYTMLSLLVLTLALLAYLFTARRLRGTAA